MPTAPVVSVIQHVSPEPPGHIADALHAKGIRLQHVRVFAGDPVPETLEGRAGLVVMGGPMGVGDAAARPHLRAEMALIEDALRRDLPVLGICLGSQLLAHVLGATVRPGAQMEVGWHPVTLTEAGATDPLWHGVAPQFPAFHWHGDVFDCPADAVVLARSAQTPVQAFRHGAQAYGLLFHLEMDAPTIVRMTRTFPEDVAAAGEQPAALRDATPDHASRLAEMAHTVFGRWARMVAAPAP